jgi:hypothetical protein
MLETYLTSRRALQNSFGLPLGILWYYDINVSSNLTSGNPLKTSRPRTPTVPHASGLSVVICSTVAIKKGQVSGWAFRRRTVGLYAPVNKLHPRPCASIFNGNCHAVSNRYWNLRGQTAYRIKKKRAPRGFCCASSQRGRSCGHSACPTRETTAGR